MVSEVRRRHRTYQARDSGWALEFLLKIKKTNVGNIAAHL